MPLKRYPTYEYHLEIDWRSFMAIVRTRTASESTTNGASVSAGLTRGPKTSRLWTTTKEG
jgi:hypothetical protein